MKITRKVRVEHRVTIYNIIQILQSITGKGAMSNDELRKVVLMKLKDNFTKWGDSWCPIQMEDERLRRLTIKLFPEFDTSKQTGYNIWEVK